MTYEELWRKAKETLESKGVPEADLNARYLLSRAVEGPMTERKQRFGPSEYFLRREEEAPSWVEADLDQMVRIRGCRVPLEYVTNSTEFMGLPLIVKPGVLIPRQDTECLVELALEHASGSVLDLCTGSGCIGLSLAALGKKITQVALADQSEKALEIASENEKFLRREKRISEKVRIDFYQGDLFSAIPDNAVFSLIVSNPPYIPDPVIETLEPEVKDHEPRMALSGGKNGLDFYKRIVKDARKHLDWNGFLILEIGYDQKEAVMNLMREAGYEEVAGYSDYAGLDRIVSGRYKNRNLNE